MSLNSNSEGREYSFSDNKMTTPRSFHDVTTPTENLAGFIF